MIISGVSEFALKIEYGKTLEDRHRAQQYAAVITNNTKLLDPLRAK